MHEETLFHEALDTPDAERGPFLDRACGSDADLRRRVQSLLDAYDNPGSFLHGPAVCVSAEAAPRHDEAERPGARIGPYKLLQQIGEGGMGAVWMAEQLEPVRRKVALKLIKPGMDSAQVVARFEQERQALALMDHPNIAKVLDAGATDTGRPYFVMELVKGMPITKYCDERHLTVEDRLRQFVSVCQAVQHAHQKGVIHRDLKPSNLLVASYDSQPVVKVIDFGVSKATGPRLTARTLFTEFGAIVGTLEYMAPEQAELNQLDVDTRSDIYSLGVLLYELLTGTTPFERKRLEETALLEVLRMIREDDPPPPSTRLSSTEQLATVAANRGLEPRKLAGLVTGDLDWIVMKALEKDRNCRYATAQSLAADIQAYLNDEPVQAGPPSAGYRLRKFFKRHRRWLATAAVLGVALLVAVGAIAGSIGWAARDKATRQASMDREIDRALDEVERLHKEGDFPGAQSAVRRAEVLVKAAGASVERHRRMHKWRMDLELAARLEDIRLLQATVRDADRDYREAFQDYGFDVDSQEPEVLAGQIRDSAVKVQLLSALHDWAWGLHHQGKPGMHRLIEVSCKAAPDPWRDQFFVAWLNNKRDVLVKMAADDKVADLPPATVLLLSRALTGAGKHDLARKMCVRVHRRHPGDVWLNIEIARLLQDAGKNQDAIGYRRAFLALRPRSPAAHTAFAYSMSMAGQYAEAEAALQEALRIQEDYFDAHLQFGQIRQKQNKLAEAEISFRRAVELRPDLCFAQYPLGIVLMLQGKFAEAEGPLREANRLTPIVPRAQYYYGYVLAELGKHAEAAEANRKAIQLDPNFAEAHCHLGRALQSLGKFAEAQASLKRGDELGRKHGKKWEHPSEKWVQEAGRMVDLEGKLYAVLSGKTHPKDQQERLDLAEMCGRKRLYLSSARLFREAFANGLPTDNTGEGPVYNAACYSALAGCGRGEETAKLDDKDRAPLRRQALGWLRADLEACRKWLEEEPRKARSALTRILNHWVSDGDFSGVRGEKALEQLPEEERSEWRGLWQEVEALRRKIAASPRK